MAVPPSFPPFLLLVFVCALPPGSQSGGYGFFPHPPFASERIRAPCPALCPHRLPPFGELGGAGAAAMADPGYDAVFASRVLSPDGSHPPISLVSMATRRKVQKVILDRIAEEHNGLDVRKHLKVDEPDGTATQVDVPKLMGSASAGSPSPSSSPRPRLRK